MLKTILRKMASNAVHSRADLAQQLNISEDLLERMLEDLARKGYLSPLSPADNGPSCAGSCGGCKVACASNSAHTHPLMQGWQLTNKGLSAAQGAD
jgi:hypothetical protein